MKGCKVTWNTVQSFWFAVIIAFIVLTLAPFAKASTLDHNLKVGDNCESVRLLQQILNKDPRTQVASSGNGAPGQETSYFGDLTRQSVLKFQELYQEDILVPAEVSQPTGYFGPFSRAKLNELAGDVMVSNNSTHEHQQTDVILPHDLKVGDNCECVRLLQQILNKDPRTQVASSGNGAPGQETSYFGDLTRQSVLKFQELYQEDILVPAEVSQPTGYFGPFSRAKLNELAEEVFVSNNSSEQNEQANAILIQDIENEASSTEEQGNINSKGHVLKKSRGGSNLSFTAEEEITGLWSDPLTWGGEVPLDGASVIIPPGKVVTLDVDIKPKSLKIDGELKFSDKDISITTDWINVSGKFIIGTESAPYTNKAIITLTGEFSSSSSMMRSKVLAVHGGVLEMHGKPINVTWTQLNETALIGATQIVLVEAPDWKSGDKIVIASTDFNPHQAEERIVTSVDGNVVSFNDPLLYMHWGEQQSAGSKTIDMRGEVGLLSRNIIVQGDESSAVTGYGGHTMIMGGGNAHIDGVEFYNLGQKSIIARYPVHFHRNNDSSGSYIKNSSIHQSYNRCVTIHASTNVLVANNVAYNAVGHCYFLENGDETGNTFSNNLGILAKKPKRGEETTPPDIANVGPSVFWISNLNNTFVGNHAAGSEGSGFWIGLPQHPINESSNRTDLWPVHTPPLKFEDNTTHSNLVDGFLLENGTAADGSVQLTTYIPKLNGDPTKANVDAYFTNTTAYKNKGMGIWGRATNVFFVGSRLADNRQGITFAGGPYTYRDTLIIGESSNLGTPKKGEKTGTNGRTLPSSPSAEIVGIDIYDGPATIDDVTFVNLTPNESRVSSGLSFREFTDFFLSATSSIKNAEYINAQAIHLHDKTAPTNPTSRGADGYRSAVLKDLDGSTTNVPGGYIVTNIPFLLTPTCTYNQAWNAWVCPNSNRYGSLVLINRSLVISNMAPLLITRSDSAVHSLLGTPSTTQAPNSFSTTLLDGETYTVSFPASSTPKILDIDYRVGGAVTIVLQYDVSQFNVYRNGKYTTPIVRVDNLANIDITNYYYDETAKLLYFKLDSSAKSRVRVVDTRPVINEAPTPQATTTPVVATTTALVSTTTPLVSTTTTPMPEDHSHHMSMDLPTPQATTTPVVATTPPEVSTTTTPIPEDHSHHMPIQATTTSLAEEHLHDMPIDLELFRDVAGVN